MNRPLYVRGTMVEDGQTRDLVIVDGVVADATPLPSREPDAAGWVLPGLADVHNHLSLASPAGDHEEPVVRVRASASVELAVGVLAIREPGSPDDASMLLAGEAGWPRVVTAGRFLSPPGGYFPGLARELAPAELARAAVEEAARSGGWAKIIGDFLGVGEFVPNWPADVLADAVAQVHAAGGRVAVHAVCPAAVDAAVAAGVDSVEHGWAVTDAHFAAMRAHNTAWVPTLMPGGSEAACEFAAAMGFSTDTREWMRAAIDAQPATVARAHAAGVTVLAGTDAGQGPHGTIADQITMLADAGTPVTAAIGAGSWAARRWLGLACLESGAPADLVLYDADPRMDLNVLRRPALIVMDGQVIESNAGFAMRD
jgi:imidazolonepropionase-like amidohydrolase